MTRNKATAFSPPSGIENHTCEAEGSGPFNTLQSRNLAAAVERILPSESGSGAKEARVVEFIHRRYSNSKTTSSGMKRLLHGLNLLQSMAEKTYVKPFHVCSPEEQDEILTQVQNIPHMTVYRFFRSLIALTLAGFLSDPIHGGNQDRVGWHFIGWEPKRPTPAPSWR